MSKLPIFLYKREKINNISRYARCWYRRVDSVEFIEQSTPTNIFYKIYDKFIYKI